MIATMLAGTSPHAAPWWRKLPFAALFLMGAANAACGSKKAATPDAGCAGPSCATPDAGCTGPSCTAPDAACVGTACTAIDAGGSPADGSTDVRGDGSNTPTASSPAASVTRGVAPL